MRKIIGIIALILALPLGLACRSFLKRKQGKPRQGLSGMSLEEKAQRLELSALHLDLLRPLEAAKVRLEGAEPLGALGKEPILESLWAVRDKPERLLRFALAEFLSQPLLEDVAVPEMTSKIIGAWVIIDYRLPAAGPSEVFGFYPIERAHFFVVDTENRRVLEAGDWEAARELFWLIIEDMHCHPEKREYCEESLFTLAAWMTRGESQYLLATARYAGPRLSLEGQERARIEYALPSPFDASDFGTLYSLSLTRDSQHLSSEQIALI